MGGLRLWRFEIYMQPANFWRRRAAMAGHSITMGGCFGGRAVRPRVVPTVVSTILKAIRPVAMCSIATLEANRRQLGKNQ